MLSRLVARADSVPGWVEALAIGLVSRGFSVLVIWGAWAFDIPHQTAARVQTPFVVWDGQWYEFIARTGYHASAVVKTPFGPGYHDFAFFPMWPYLVRLLSFDGQETFATVGPVTANVLFLVAAIAFHAILDRVGGRSIARWGLALFAFSPAAYVYSMAYGESLFLVFVGAFFVTIARPWDRIQGFRLAILTAAAQLTRITGAALAFASIPDLFRRETRVRGIVIIGSSVVAFAAWWTFIAILTGNPMGYMLGTPSWFLNQHAYPIPTGIASFFYAFPDVSTIAVLFIALVVVGSRWLAQRGEWRLALYCLACIASCALDTQTTMPRLVAVAFPAFGGLAAVLPSWRWRAALLVVFAGVQAALAGGAVQRYLVP
jgi:Mannosyltransferase (PIG-V)